MKTRDLLGLYFKKLFSKKIRKKIRKLKNFDPRPVTKKDSDTYYQLLSSAVHQHVKENLSLAEAMEPLHNAFNSRNVRSRQLGSNWWHNFLTAAASLDGDGYKVQESLIKEIENLRSDYFEHWELLHIYSLALRVGLILVGYSLRVKAREAAIAYISENVSSDSYKYSALLAALLERGEIENFKYTFKKYRNKHKKEKKDFAHLYNILYNSHGYNQFAFSGKDRKFLKFIKKRKIAVVGPAKTVSPDASKIDSHDVVVRCNYREQGVGIDSEIKGLRCDLTYFNFEQSKDFCNQERINWPDGISWVICKSVNSADKVKRKIFASAETRRKKVKPKVRYLKNISNTIFMNTPNAMSNIVMDLLKFNPDSIMIFHADMMLTVTRNDGYYPSSWNRGGVMEQTFLKFSSRSHEPVIQYWVLHTLFNNGKIKGDKRFEEVMLLGENEYMSQIQSI